MKRFMAGIATGFAGVALLAASAGAQDFVFKYGNSQPEAAPRSQSMVLFKEELEKRTEGRIAVENYFGAVLGNEREMMDQVTTGLLQGTRGGFFTDASSKYTIFMLPFLVESWDQALCLVNSDFAGTINAEASQGPYHIPATGISQGFRADSNNERPITSPADFDGLKIRVPQQEVFILTKDAVGASPQAMPYSEVYQALKTGVLDGQDNAPANIYDYKIYDYKIYEVQKYMTLTYYATGPDPFIVNKAWYDSLPDDLKTIFDEVAVEAIQYSDQLNRESESEYIDKLCETLECNTVEGDALKPFQEMVQPVYQHFVDKGDFSAEEIEAAKAAARTCS